MLIETDKTKKVVKTATNFHDIIMFKNMYELITNETFYWELEIHKSSSKSVAK